MKFQKLFAGVVSLTMFTSTLAYLPVTASAEEETSKTFTYDGYTVDYNVTNSWGDTDVISVTITNTGTETIENWMLAYDDFCGKIDSVWDAKEEKTDSGYKYIKNSGYNANISPDSSVTFSYTLESSTGTPKTIVMAQNRLEKPSSGYYAELKVNEEWGNSFNGEIVLENRTDKPIECWELTFDSNFTITKIKSSWAASLTDNGNCNYTFKGTYTGIVAANSSVSLGFQADKNGTPEIRNTKLTEVVFSDSIERSNDDLADIGDAYYKKIQSENDIETYGFTVDAPNSIKNVNLRLAARSSKESLRLDGDVIATNIHPTNYPGVYFHFFDTEKVRNNKIFSIGFNLTNQQINDLREIDSSAEIHILTSHGDYGTTPNENPILIKVSDIINNWDAQNEFVKFCDISYNTKDNSYKVNSDYWLLDSKN